MPRDSRPDPDALLATASSEEPGGRRPGRLKIFLGASAGVGKTYAMLQAAQERRAKGRPVLVGVVETHGRAETEALLDGLELLPRRTLVHRGTALAEFDLDGALERRPELILVDELAHTNVPGSRHAKRWQDVEELLAAGVDVWATLNVQHLESLNDVVAQITGVVVRETLPDAVLERADDVELVDLTPDELIRRLEEGKVYVPEVAGRALERFFRKGNLIALRELALRATADRVDAQMEVWRRAEPGAATWPVAERLVVCISASPSAMQLVRAGRRMAARSRAEWIVVWVDTPRQQSLPSREREHAARALRLAESLGAEAVTLDGQRAAEELVEYARRRNASRIVVGKPGRFWWRDRLVGSFLSELLASSGEIEVTVVRGDATEPAPGGAVPRAPFAWPPYAWAAGVVAGATLVAGLTFPWFELSNLVMTYLLGVVIVAGRWGRGPASFAATLSVAAFDFFFVAPHLTFAVSDTQYIVTFAVMLIVGLVIGTLTARNREQAEMARRREREAVALYSLARELAATRGTDPLVGATVRHLGELFGVPVAVLLPGADGVLRPVGSSAAEFALRPDELGVAQWAYRRAARAGWGTGTLPGSSAVYVPLITATATVGVLGLGASPDLGALPLDQMHLLEAFASQVALALEREQLAAAAEQARLRAEAERMQSALLSSVSHDLRTPLASIVGSASTLVERGGALDGPTRRDLSRTILDEAQRLARLVGNLLDMTRLSAGAVTVQREWHALEELVGAALERIGDERLAGRNVTIDLPADLPLVAVDGVLIEQLIVNLLDNAVRYSPAGSPLEIVARRSGGEVWLMLADRGPGLAPGEETLVFERFARGSAGASSSGSGLGLAICRAIVDAHGGRISAANRKGGGAVFRIGLPLVEPPAESDPPAGPTAK